MTTKFGTGLKAGSETRLFVGPPDRIQPQLDGLPIGAEWLWLETDGAGWLGLSTGTRTSESVHYRPAWSISGNSE